MERLVQLIVLVGVSFFVYKTIRKFLGKVGGNLFKSFFIGSGEIYSTCPDCNQRNGIDDIVNTKTISSKHEHERVNGKKDERYTKNDLVDKTEYTYKCKKCGNEFKSVKDEKRGSTDSILGKFVDLGNSSRELGESIRKYDDYKKKMDEEYERDLKNGGPEKRKKKRDEYKKKSLLKTKEKLISEYGEIEGMKVYKFVEKYGVGDGKKVYRLTQRFGVTDGKKVFEGKIWEGMSSQMLISSKGNPDHKIEKVSRGKKREEFFYDGYKNLQGNMSYKFRVVLINGKVDGWNDITN
jgi:hypothetical protein